MPNVEFLAGEGFNINNLSGSGIGFYGDSGFGYSIAVGNYQGRTFITDSTGTVQGPEVDNNKYGSPSGVIWGQVGSGYLLQELPNYLSTLNIRFTNATAVKTQNVVVFGSQRGNQNVNPSGVALQAAEIIHPSNTATLTGSGDALWTQLQGSATTMSLVASPGTSGYRPNGVNTSDTQHDWFVSLAANPTSAGAKEFQIEVELEYI